MNEAVETSPAHRGSASFDLSVRNLLRIALPVSAGQFVTFALVVTDNYFMSRIGQEEMNAVATAGLLYITLAMVAIGLAAGTQILVARRNGEREYTRAGESLANSALIGFILSVIMFVLLRWVSTPLIYQWVSSPTMAQKMVEFIRVRSWGLLPYMMAVLFNGFFTGAARTAVVGISTAISAGLNILLCYLFVFGHGGFEAMGYVGAARANVISEVVALAVLVFVAFNSKHIRHFSLAKAFASVPVRYTASLLRLSGPIMIQLLLSLAIWFIFFLFVEKLGAEELQASHIIRTCYLLALISVMGFAQTTRTVISTLIAESRQTELWLAMKRLIGLNFLGILIVGHGLVLYPAWLAHFFTSDPHIIELTVQCMHVVFPAMVVFSVTSILLNTVEGSGNTFVGMVIEAITTVGYLWLSWYLTLVVPHPVYQVWMADWLYFVSIGLLSALYLRFGRWKSKVI